MSFLIKTLPSPGVESALDPMLKPTGTSRTALPGSYSEALSFGAVTKIYKDEDA